MAERQASPPLARRERKVKNAPCIPPWEVRSPETPCTVRKEGASGSLRGSRGVNGERGDFKWTRGG